MNAPSGYLGDSALSDDGLDLQTALGRTPAGLVEHPELFRGFLARPDVTAAGLLAVADVAASRYADPGLAKRLASLDPVVTAGGDRLRFESFSACNGVHARFDLLADGIDSGEAAFGTTNVDINQPLRTALAAVERGSLLHLGVGGEHLRVSTPDASFVERQVALPDRWVRGFAETPLLARDARFVAELRGPAVPRFLAGLPRGAPPGQDVHLRPLGRELRAVLDAGPDTVLLAGSARLRGFARIARYSSKLRVYAGTTGTSGWVFDLPGGRFTLLLSPGGFRGFSGEGSLLTLLAHPDAELAGGRVAAALEWQPTIDRAAVARHAGLTADEVEAGLGWLAASGRVGYDLAEQRWFHRDLPVDAELVLKRNPRLTSAQKLLDEGGVASHEDHWHARGRYRNGYVIRDDPQRAALRCTCEWEAEHHGTRGPCKHILAVHLLTAMERTADQTAPTR